MKKKNYDVKLFLVLCLAIWMAYIVREVSLAAFN